MRSHSFFRENGMKKQYLKTVAILKFIIIFVRHFVQKSAEDKDLKNTLIIALKLAMFLNVSRRISKKMFKTFNDFVTCKHLDNK